jgi:hypothetical protein
MANDNEIDQKKAFAKALIEHPDEHLKAGFLAFKNNAQLAMKASIQWVSDEIVCTEMKRLMGLTEPESNLPTKEEHCEKLYKIFDSDLPLKDRLVASDQIMKIQGFVNPDKGNTTVNNKILIMSNSGTDEDWEKKIAKQQQDLVERTLKTIEVRDVSNE